MQFVLKHGVSYRNYSKQRQHQKQQESRKASPTQPKFGFNIWLNTVVPLILILFCGIKTHLISLTDPITGPSYAALQIKRERKKKKKKRQEREAEPYPTFPWLSARLSSHHLQTTCTDPAHSGGRKYLPGKM